MPSKNIKYLHINVMTVMHKSSTTHVLEHSKLYNSNFLQYHISSFGVILIKIPGGLEWVCIEVDKLILNFLWRCKGLRRAKIILKKNKFGGVSL
jgi:hypothetical protein